MPVATKRAPKAPVNDELVPIHSGVETWRNETAGVVTINRVGEYGRKVVDLIQGGRSFQVTPVERRLNQNACATRDLDVFTNGALRPVDLIEGEPDTELLKANPNTFTDEELTRIFALKGEYFVQRIAQITNPVALSRLLDIARDPRYDATLSQYEAVKSRELELKDELGGEPPERDATGIGRAVTPK